MQLREIKIVYCALWGTSLILFLLLTMEIICTGDKIEYIIDCLSFFNNSFVLFTLYLLLFNENYENE